MNNGNGYLKLFRSTLNNPIVMKDGDYLAVWTWLLMKVCYFPQDVMFKGERITLQPGQRTLSRTEISSDLKISESKVQRILKTFENERMIEQQMSNQCRLISICSWDKYQSDEQQTEQQVNSDRTASERRVNTKKEYKNIRNIELKEKEIKEKENRYDEFSPPVQESLLAYEEMRKRKKFDFGDKARTLFLNKLKKLSGGDEELMVELIDEATLNNWKSVYPPKDVKAKQSGLRYSDIEIDF